MQVCNFTLAHNLMSQECHSRASQPDSEHIIDWTIPQW